jgi:rubredoxin
MKDKVRCKACGYILDKDALGEVCPACGVKKEMFEPWDDKVGAVRRAWIEFDLHPVVVHAPETLALLLLLGTLVFPLFSAGAQTTYLWPVIQLLSWIFPVTVLGGYLTGLADGKVRYRKVTTPLLLQKIIVGAVFILASLTQALLASVANFATLSLWLGYLAAAAVSMACGAILGKWGATLVVGAMPGDKIFMGKKKKKPAAKTAPAKVPEEKKE